MGEKKGSRLFPLPPADTGDVSCGLRFNTQFGFVDQVLRNCQALIGRRGKQLLKSSWQLQAPPLGIPDHTTGTAACAKATSDMFHM